MIQKEIKDLVLIHGWGFDSRIWRNFIPLLEGQWRVTCVDLPGYGISKNKVKSHAGQGNIDQVVNSIVSDIPENSTILAWSLGGTIAMKLAHRRSDIKALVLIASSPCFLNKQDWHHGVEPDDFNKLISQLNEDKIKTLQTFAGLVAMGEEYPRQVINELNEHFINNVPEQEILMAGLEILRHEDLRQVMVKQQCPVGMIFGENDVLVKRATGSAIQISRPDIHIIEIPQAGHAPFVLRPQETAGALIKLTASFF